MGTRIRNAGVYVSAVAPATSTYLVASVPTLVEVNRIRREGDGRRSRFHNAVAGTPGGDRLNRTPPPEGRWDIEIDWGSLTPVCIWEAHAKMAHQILRVATRPSAL